MMRRLLSGCTAALLALVLSTNSWAQGFSQKDFDYAKELLSMKPQGPAGKPWEQNLGGHEIDTSKYKKPGPYAVCF